MMKKKEQWHLTSGMWKKKLRIGFEAPIQLQLSTMAPVSDPHSHADNL